MAKKRRFTAILNLPLEPKRKKDYIRLAGQIGCSTAVMVRFCVERVLVDPELLNDMKTMLKDDLKPVADMYTAANRNGETL